MGHRFAQIMFTESVQKVQEEQGSRVGYAAMEQGEDFNFVLSNREQEFIEARDSFYLGSVSETGWPYVQHRGGPAGFVRVINSNTIGLADFSGNRQYVSVGNIKKDNRVSLFFMDYPNQSRLKVLGRARLVGTEETEILAMLKIDGYQAEVERGFLIDIEAFDWNCPQFITPRYTKIQVGELISPLKEENRILKSSFAGDVEQSAGLGEGPLELVVSGIRKRTNRIRSYELRAPDGSDLPKIEAGAHLPVPVKLQDEKADIRHYSISSNPQDHKVYEITVLLEENSRGGSNAVHKTFAIDLPLHCHLPQNHFRLHPDVRPSVLIAGGIGITPIRAMTHVLKSRNNDMHLHYAGRSESEMAFVGELVYELNHRLTLYRSSAGERLNVKQVLSSAPKEAIFYVCGPDRLIGAVTKAAAELGVKPDRIQFERFLSTIDPGSKPIRVELSRSSKKVAVRADQTILDALLDADVEVPFSCRAGNCRTCVARVLEGEPDHKDSALSAADRKDHKLMCLCVSRAKTEHLVLDI